MVCAGGHGIGTLLAIIFPMDDITGFLYFIGSVFAPMIAVLIADFFVLKRSSADTGLDITNLIVWFAGFVCYRLFLHIDLITGSTIPAMAVHLCPVPCGRNYKKEVLKMKCVIIGGAPISNYEAAGKYIDGDDFIICCDSGLYHAQGLGAVPSLIVGDFDSHPAPDTDIETITLPCEKDDTDTVFAAKPR